LPTGPKPRDLNILHYLFLVYGREKIGKTTLFSQWPDVLFATTEPGTKGLEINEFNWQHGGVTDWNMFRACVELLTTTKHGFNLLVVDTADRAYDMCLDWVCANRGIEYPGQDAHGEEDWGKSWRAVRQEFLGQIHKVVQAGIGVGFTSHVKEVTINTRSGSKYDKIMPSMSNQARAVIEALIDYFFYAEYVRDKDGNTRRILICQGDETVWAGARPGATKNFPALLPLQAEGGYDVIHKAFLGQYAGLDPRTLAPAKSTTKTGSDFIKRQRTRAAVKTGTTSPLKKGGKRAVRKRLR
jgi:hypothetical protein